MNLRNLVRTYNYLSPQQKIVMAIAAVLGSGVLLCIPLLSLQPSRPPAVSTGGSVGNPNGGQNPSGENNTEPSQAAPLDTANPIDLPADSSAGTGSGSDSAFGGTSTNSSGGEGSNSLDTTDPLDERVANQRRSPASSNDSLSNNVDNPYSQSTMGRYQSPTSISNSPYSASPGGSGNLSTAYSRTGSGGSSASSSSSRLSNLEPAKGNNFTYLNPFSPNNGTGTSGANSSTTNLPNNPAAVPSQSAIAPSGLAGTNNGMNASPGSGSSNAPQTTPAPTNQQNPSFPTPSSPSNPQSAPNP